MNYNFLIDNKICKDWYIKKDFIFRGYFFYNELLYKNEDAYGIVNKLYLSGKLYSVLEEFNGNFSFIYKNNDDLICFTDVIRSIPLFYLFYNNNLVISNNINNIIDKYKNYCKFDYTLVKEFKKSGFISGNKTLIQNIYQLQAGEALSIKNNKVLKVRYFEFLHKDYYKSNKNNLFKLFEQVVDKSFNRLISTIQEKFIIIPLSGGYDSRLIITMLYKLGYKNVIAFSYGKKENTESKISKEIATSLGYRWEFVCYSKDLWNKWFNSKERIEYYNFAGQFVSLPHEQDWPAIWLLKKNNLIPDDCVFVPGHTGDFISGGHIPNDIIYSHSFNKEYCTLKIIEKHYNLNKKISFDGKYTVKNIIKDFNCNTKDDVSNIIEYFDWQERQSKFIVNSVRAYEYWGYDWRLPLWDGEIVNFWKHMPFEYRYKKVFYNEFVIKTYKEILKKNKIDNFQKINGNKRFHIEILNIFKQFLKGNKIIHDLYNKYHYVFNDDLCLTGVFDSKDVKECIKSNDNINSLLILKYLNQIENK